MGYNGDALREGTEERLACGWNQALFDRMTGNLRGASSHITPLLGLDGNRAHKAYKSEVAICLSWCCVCCFCVACELKKIDVIT